MPHLAIAGGQPLLARRQQRWSWPPLDDGSRDAIADYLRDGGTLTPRGAEGILGRCETKLAERVGVPHAVLCSSGTMALYSAFAAVGLGPGDELICPAVTFHATGTPALHLGARVVLADVEADTGNILPSAISAAITPRTKAVVTNAMWGHPVAQEEIRTICDRKGLAWIEDISHAHFASWNGRQVGTWGDIACMSLGAEKIVSGGLGGAVLTRRRDLFEAVVLTGHYLYRSRQEAQGGDVRDPRLAPVARTGYGLKLGCHPLSAVAILHQLEHRIDGWIADRDRSLRALRADLNGLMGLVVPPIRDGVTSMGGWYGFKPWIDRTVHGRSRESIAAALTAEGVEADPAGSPGLHALAIFRGHPLANGRTPQLSDLGTFSQADNYHSGLLSLPTCTGERDEERRRQLVAAFRKVWEHLDEVPTD